MLQMLTTQTNKSFYLQRVSLFGCAVSICSVFLYLVLLWAFAVHVLSSWWSCFLNLQVFFSICCAFLYLVVLWAFVACVLSNWWSCFLNLQVFFLFAVRWALSATALLSPCWEKLVMRYRGTYFRLINFTFGVKGPLQLPKIKLLGF